VPFCFNIIIDLVYEDKYETITQRSSEGRLAEVRLNREGLDQQHPQLTAHISNFAHLCFLLYSRVLAFIRIYSCMVVSIEVLLLLFQLVRLLFLQEFLFGVVETLMKSVPD
jgi:hypothetical protein